jgi:hypothetical protein
VHLFFFFFVSCLVLSGSDLAYVHLFFFFFVSCLVLSGSDLAYVHLFFSFSGCFFTGLRHLNSHDGTHRWSFFFFSMLVISSVNKHPVSCLPALLPLFLCVLVSCSHQPIRCASSFCDVYSNFREITLCVRYCHPVVKPLFVGCLLTEFSPFELPLPVINHLAFNLALEVPRWPRATTKQKLDDIP